MKRVPGRWSGGLVVPLGPWAGRKGVAFVKRRHSNRRNRLRRSIRLWRPAACRGWLSTCPASGAGGTGSDLAAVSDGTVIAVCTKQSAERYVGPKKYGVAKKSKDAIWGSVWGSVSHAKSTTSSEPETGSDARFLSKVRQIDVIGLCYVLICNQEVAGSIPVRSIYLQIAGSVWGQFLPETRSRTFRGCDITDSIVASSGCW
jgi:hypothetical protein